MSIIRTTLVVFLAGWAAWLLMDKTDPAYAALAYAPRERDLLQDLQMAVHLVRSGHGGPAFAFLWRGHHLLLSVGVGVTVALLGGPLLSRAKDLVAARRRGRPAP